MARAAASIEKVARGDTLDPADRAALEWTGEFLSAVDWAAPAGSTNKVSGGLALQATTVRPTFYSCLFAMGPQLREAGMTKEDDITSFLNGLYRNLTSSGAPGRGYKKLTPRDSQLGSLLLRQMAESILVQINNNGLPRPDIGAMREPAPVTSDLAPAFI